LRSGDPAGFGAFQALLRLAGAAGGLCARGDAFGDPGHRVDGGDNLALASRNLPNVLVTEPRYADPLSLVFYKKVLVTKAAIEQFKEMYA